jgi:hypothetical protein
MPGGRMCGCAHVRLCGCLPGFREAGRRVRMGGCADVRMANLNCSGSLVCNVSFLAESRRKRGDAEEIICVLCAPQRLREKEPDEI